MSILSIYLRNNYTISSIFTHIVSLDDCILISKSRYSNLFDLDKEIYLGKIYLYVVIKNGDTINYIRRSML
jgi:hypothetical protein